MVFDVDAGKRNDVGPEVASCAGRGVANCWACPSFGDGRNGVNECLDRRRDLVADGSGVLPTPPRLVRASCILVMGGVWCCGRAEKPSSAGEGIETCWLSLDFGFIGAMDPAGLNSSFLMPIPETNQ